MSEAWDDYFDPGETLLWQGAPERSVKISPIFILLAVFGLPFLMAGLSISLGALAILFGADFRWVQSAGSLFGFFFGMPFIAVGAAMVFGPYYAQSQAHRYIRYALTNRRAYIASDWFNRRKLQVLSIAMDAPITIENNRSVFFHTEVGTDSDGDRSTDRKGFENIAGAMEVYKLIRAMQTTTES